VNRGEELLASLAEGPLELATLASLAGRVEPQLIRALRLELAPARSAADEADLWFSAIVENTTATGLVFFSEALPLLQQRLANDPSRRLGAAWQLLFRLRTRVDYAEHEKVTRPTWLLVQEELTYWAVRGGPDTAEDRDRIATLCAWVENSLADDRLAADAESWIESVHLRLPVGFWSMPGTSRLASAAETLLPIRPLWVRRVEDGVELSARQLTEAHMLETAAPAGAIRVSLVARDGPTRDRHEALIEAAGATLIKTVAPTVDLYLADGQAFQLKTAITYEYGVYISYAHVDDVELAGGSEPLAGWVRTLVSQLEEILVQRMGRRDACKVWFDNRLRGDEALTEEIAAVLERSATFVAIVSPRYLKSAWCLKELELFTRRSAAELARRVFIVEKAPIDRSEIPSVVRDLRGYQFWYRDHDGQAARTFAIPGPRPDTIEYFRQIQDLASDLWGELKDIRLGSSVTVADCVLLAEVTDDLKFKRREVQRYLEQQGLRVLPKTSYPSRRAEFEAALNVDLARSSLFVQLLGPITGERPPDVPDGYGWLQLECALRRGCRVLQWRSPELDLAEIESSRQHELLERETVQATSLEEFKRAVAAAVTRRVPRREIRGQSVDRPLVFLNSEASDRAFAAEIRAAIGDRVYWIEPLRIGSAAEIRQDLEQNLMECDAVVLVYGANLGRAHAQLRQVQKLARLRDRPIRAILVIDAPPANKPELGFALPGMTVIEARQGIRSEVATRVAATLGT
jgi:hypothetical protein